MKIYTIGSSGKNLRRFAELIRTSRVDRIIDVRLNNTSQLAGYAKRDDLEFVLELIGVPYEHHPELAPGDDLLAIYRKDKDWDAYRVGFDRLIRERDMLGIGRGLLAQGGHPCLLCSEDDSTKCHRRLVAELWADGINGVEVVHL